MCLSVNELNGNLLLVANIEPSRISQVDVMWLSCVCSHERSRKDAAALEALSLVQAWPLTHISGGHQQGGVAEGRQPLS